MKYPLSLVSTSLLVLVLAAACSDSDGDDQPDGGGGDGCTLKHSKACVEDTTYWVDSCGNRGDVAELCDCGCNQELSACASPCACTPDCTDKTCGDDGCDGSCGECAGGTTCSAAGVCVGEQTPNRLTIASCSAPYVLDASKVSDVIYMTSHFADLVQQYCITGTVGGEDITAFPEKMVYGQHDASNVVSLLQVSMTESLAPKWTVKLEFKPDTDFTTGSVWIPVVTVPGTPQVSVTLLRHDGDNICVEAIARTGEVNVVKAEDCTLIEGGTFEIQGAVAMFDAQSVSNFCAASSVPCCP